MLPDHISALAEEVLWPAADDVDRGVLPVSKQLDRLASQGLYGAALPLQAGGLGLSEHGFRRTVEVLAGADLTAAFVWIQHQGAAKRVLRSSNEALRDRWLGDLASGRVRAGVAVGGVRPPTPTLVARRDGSAWVLDGTIPWVTGWGLIDVVLIAARVIDDAGTGSAEQDVVWLLADAPQPVGDTTTQIDLDVPTMTASRFQLVALDHTRSASVQLDGHRVPGDRLVARQGPEEWAAADSAGLRTNGSLSLGLAERCRLLLEGEEPALSSAIEQSRHALDTAEVEDLPAARATAGLVAWTAAGRLLVARGGRSVALQDSAQRLAREAMVLQVFGTRPPITRALLEQSAAALDATVSITG